ncbi:MAG: SDR family oxidoreductase [Ghiorsea sp.]|nr:SDR family oxidoreductase [Ghiorsea sp.]
MKKQVVITGATGGMGRAITRHLLKDYRIIAIGQNIQALTPCLQDVAICDLATYEVDIATTDWVDQLDTLLNDSPLHGIVNLAGVSCGDSLGQLTDADWNYSFAVNVTAPMKLIRWAAPHLKKHGQGSIINVGSPVGVLGARKSSYAASKSALHGLTMSVARELGKENIRANLLLPGPTITDMTRDWSEEKRQNIASGTFLKRLCEPEEIAQMISFLLSDDSSYMTGSVVDMTAGSMLGH